MTTWISADQIFDGENLRRDHAILISGGKVADIQPTRSIPSTQIKCHHNGLITPGFFDIQVNGGGGVLLNTTPTRGGIATIAAAHRTFGTVALLPTVITDTPQVLEAAVDAALRAKDVQGFAGLHIEGPHISITRRGTHAAHHIRPMDDHTIELVRRLIDDAVPTLITVAPENASNSQIAQLREMGAVVSIGHSDASAAQAQGAVDAGATCFTHLFNAMSPMLSRTPGVTGTAISSDVWCSIIADGIHVDPLMVALAIRARPQARRMIAVSDAMSTVGGPDQFSLYGQNIALRDGRLVNSEGSLAGAHLTMHDALRNLVGYGIPLETALQMCRSNPFDLLGMGARSNIVGLATDDILGLDDDLGISHSFKLAADL